MLSPSSNVKIFIVSTTDFIIFTLCIGQMASDHGIHCLSPIQQILVSLIALPKHAYIILTPLNPPFYIVKLGFTGVYFIFLIFAQKHRLLVFVRTASAKQF